MGGEATTDLPNLTQFAGGFVHSDNKKWVKPHLQSIDRRVLEAWDRDELLRARYLVHRALDLIEASDEAPEVAAKVRALLAEIDAKLAK